MSSSNEIIVNGWILCAHPVFLDQYESLITEVEKLKEKDPHKYKHKNSAKRLAAIEKLAFAIIPNDPTLSEYRQGTTVGEEHINKLITSNGGHELDNITRLEKNISKKILASAGLLPLHENNSETTDNQSRLHIYSNFSQ